MASGGIGADIAKILMNVLPWWVYVATDVARISLEGSAVTVSQATLLLLTRLDAEISTNAQK